MQTSTRRFTHKRHFPNAFQSRFAFDMNVQGGLWRAQERVLQTGLGSSSLQQGCGHNPRRKPHPKTKPKTAAHDSISVDVEMTDDGEDDDGVEDDDVARGDWVVCRCLEAGYIGSVIALTT